MQKSEHNYCTPIKCVDDSFSIEFHKNAGSSWETFDANNNSPSTHVQPKLEVDVAGESHHSSSSSRLESDEKSVVVSSPIAKPKSTFWSLDTAFPEPMNFTGANHPFLTEFEQDNLRKQRQHFEKQLEILSTFLLEEGEQKTGKNASPVVSPLRAPPSAVKDVKGFKGELADLIKSTCGSSASTPKKTKGSQQSAETSAKEEKLFDQLNTPKNGVLSRRNHFSHHSKNGKSAKSISAACCVSRAKVSPRKDRINLKNGISIRSEPSTSKDDRFEDSISAQKRLKALRRCLKKLSPTCGFRFPVLEESHAVVDSALAYSLPDSKRPTSGASPTPLSAAAAGVPARSASNSLSKSGNKSRKRKNEQVEHGRKAGVRDQCSQSMDSVRRSHRSRSAVQRFQAASGSRGYGMAESAGSRNGSHLDGEQYDVISLRIGQEDGLVEYLIGWSQ